MNIEEELSWSVEVIDFVRDLLNKADVCNEKTANHANCTLSFPDGYSVPIRVDDIQLLFIGARLLPNIMNYLVNILPQYLYPYVVAYVQEFSDESQSFTFHDLSEIIKLLTTDN